MTPLFVWWVAAAGASERFNGATWYLGDLHAHTSISGDAGSEETGTCTGTCGPLSDFVQTAKDNGLDFLAVTDHTNGNATTGYPQSTDAAYADLIATMLAANEPGQFVTIPAAEVWFQYGPSYGGGKLGHKNLLLFGSDTDLAAFSRADTWPRDLVSYTSITACADITAWIAEVQATYGDALIIPHHPVARSPMATDWSCNQGEAESLVEVYSVWGNSFEPTPDFDPVSVPSPTGSVHSALDMGLRLGFVGATDRHDTRPGEVCATDQYSDAKPYGGGLTILRLPEGETFDRPEIHDALVARHSLATTGPFLPVDLDWSSGEVSLGGLGDDIGVPEGQSLVLEVAVPAEDADVVLAVDLVTTGPSRQSLTDTGDGVWRITLSTDTIPDYAYVDVTVDGDAWWGAGCDDAGTTTDEHIWSSPSWFERVPADLDGDGSGWLDGDCDDDDPAVYPGAPDAWLDGVDQDCDGVDAEPPDADGDTWTADLDCDDTRADVWPGAVETWYDGVDADCAGDSDDDADGDGLDAESRGGVDCNDADALIWPGAPEDPTDGIDSDCDGTLEPVDGDGDGHDATVDCDDTDPAVHPGAPEIWYDGIDEDCAGDSDWDQDGDGVTAPAGGGTDCDDTNAAVKPGAREIWYDGVDQNCDGRNDDDRDGDSYAAATRGGTDCNDGNAAVKPGATEVWYDGVDQNCDGRNDYDRDGDGYPSNAWGGTDCDDARGNIRPGAREIVGNGRDENCNGSDLG